MTHTSEALQTTHTYRALVARVAATGGEMPAINMIAFGSGDAPYSPEADIGLKAELIRLPAQAEPDGPVLTVRATLSGAHVTSQTIREIGALTADGTLVGRRVLKPLELEPFAELDIEMTFEY